MRNSERGSSQVPFVISLVLLIIAAGWGYMMMGERDSAEARVNKILETAREEGGQVPGDDRVRDLIRIGMQEPLFSSRLAEVGPKLGWPDEVNPDMWVDPAKIDTAVESLLTALDSGEFTVDFPQDRYIEGGGGISTQQGESWKKSYQGSRLLQGETPKVSNVFEVVIVPSMRDMIKDIKLYRDAFGRLKNENETLNSQYAQNLAAKDAEIQQKTNEISAMEATKNQEIAQLRTQIGDLEQQKASAEASEAQTKDELTARIALLERELSQKTQEVAVLKQRKRAVETDSSPDGTVTAVADDRSFLVIDLGKADNLMKGTNFDVYGIGKGGREVAKGVAKVVSVDNQSAKATIVMLHDAYNPIVPGDNIRSYTYDPNETIHFALAGRFVKMGKSDAARRLQALGAAVDANVGISTHYLVIGQDESDAEPIEESQAYKDAQLYGIPVITEAELSRFTMY